MSEYNKSIYIPRLGDVPFSLYYTYSCNTGQGGGRCGPMWDSGHPNKNVSPITYYTKEDTCSNFSTTRERGYICALLDALNADVIDVQLVEKLEAKIPNDCLEKCPLVNFIDFFRKGMEPLLPPKREITDDSVTKDTEDPATGR